MSKKNNNIIYLETAHIAPMRTLFEVLKDIMTDTTIEFIRQPDAKVDEKSDKKRVKKSKSESDEANTQFSGMRILTVSPEGTIIIYLRLYADKFEKFICEPSSYRICVNLVDLNKIFKSTEKDDELIMYIDRDDKQSLVISTNNKTSRKRYDYRVKLMEVGSDNIKLPPSEFDVDVTMSSLAFNKLCKDIYQFGSQLEIKCTCNTIIFSCEGKNVTPTASYTTAPDGENEDSSSGGVKIKFVNKNKDLIVQNKYELKHLNVFSKCASLSGEIKLLIKAERFPICLRYSVATLGHFVALISPVSDTQDTYEEAEGLYQSDDDEVTYKTDLTN